MKWSLVHITPFQIVFFRLVFGFLPVLMFALMSRQLVRSHLKYLGHFLVMAIFAVTDYYLFVKGTELLPSGIAGAISGAVPLFTYLLSVIFISEEKLTFKKSIGVVLGLFGVFLVARPFDSQLTADTSAGVLYLSLAALGVGASFVYARRFITPLNIPAGVLTTYQLGLASILMLFITNYTGIEQIFTDGYATAGLVLGLGLLGTGVVFILYYYIVDHLGATTASSATYIPPVVALIIGVLLLNETITALDWLATAFIFVGVILLRQKP